MSSPAIIALTLLCLLLLSAYGTGCYFYRSRTTRRQPTSYARRRPLNPFEQALYWRLKRALPDHIILAKVALPRCIAARGPDMAIIMRESLDFIVCNQAMHIIAAIEIEDDVSSMTAYRSKVRQVKEEALKAAGIRLITCSSHSLLSAAYIAMTFDQHTTQHAQRTTCERSGNLFAAPQ